MRRKGYFGLMTLAMAGMVALCSPVASQAAADVVIDSQEEKVSEGEDFLYTLDASKGTATITGYSGSETDLVIPDQIWAKNICYKVTAISDFAFGNQEQLETVTMGDDITEIGEQAFFECTNLQSVHLSESLKVIPGECFYKCESLEEITIPDKVTKISWEAFYGCESLSNIQFSSQGVLEEIGSSAFQRCNLTKVEVPEGVKTMYYGVFAGNPVQKLVLPSTLQECQWDVLSNDDQKTVVIKTKSKDIHWGSDYFGRNAEIYGTVQIEDYDYFPIYSVSKGEGTALANGSVKLTWKELSPVARYKVLRSDQKEGNYQELDTVSETTYTDLTAQKDKIYYYKICVTYTDTLGETVDGFYSSPIKTGVPKTPVLKKAQAIGYYQAKITWEKVSQADGYGIYRKKQGGSFKKIATVTKGSSYTDKNVEGGVTYYYTVSAYRKSDSGYIWGDYDVKGKSVTVKQQKKLVNLVAGKTYQKYDITGDGKPDKIQWKKSYQAIRGSEGKNNMVLYINGKKALTCSLWEPYSGGRYVLDLCSLNKTSVFLSVRFESAMNDSQEIHQLYRYKGGKCRKVMDFQKKYKVNGMLSSRVEEVTNNKLVIRISGITAYGYTYKTKSIPLKKLKS